MTERADQMVLEYLAKVSDAAHRYLPPQRRTAYVADLRSRIDSARAKAGAGDPDRVRRVLRSFGEPAALVERECSGGGEASGSADGSDESASGASDPDNTTHATRGGERKPPTPLGGLARPVRLERDPPPWRGGPKRGRLRRRDDGTAAEPKRGGRGFSLRANSPAMLLLWLITATRKHPLEVFSLVLYLFGGIIGPIAFVWVIGAAQVLLSGVWATRDKWAAIGVPVAATLLGMAVWQGEASFVDEFILGSLLDTGVVGLRIGLVGCAVYLAARIAITTRAEES